MRAVFFSCLLAGLSATAANSLSVGSFAVDATNRLVTVGYSLSEAPCIVTLDIETNTQFDASGDWIPVNAGRTYGDAARRVEYNGAKTAYCKVGGEELLMPGVKMRVVLTAWELSAPPPYMAVDMEYDGLVSYYSCAGSVPGGVGHDDYKTSKILMRKIPAREIKWRQGSPDGEYGRNSGECAHRVELSADYYIGVYEVTRGQWAYCGLADPSEFSWPGRSMMLPLHKADYRNVRGTDKIFMRTGSEVGSGTFIDWCRKHTGVPFDLPSEAQWEFACRAGSGNPTYRGYYGDDNQARTIEDISKIAWFSENSAEGCSERQVHEVGLKQPNDWGLYDMIGNVREFCLDLYSETYYQNLSASSSPTVDPLGPSQNEYNRDYIVNRGGGFDINWWKQRSASRECDLPHAQSNRYGFRLCAPAVVAWR